MIFVENLFSYLLYFSNILELMCFYPPKKQMQPKTKPPDSMNYYLKFWHMK